MRPKIRSQPATNFASGGLPVCLSGIGIYPRVQATHRYPRLHLHHRHELPEIEPSETAVTQRGLSYPCREIAVVDQVIIHRLRGDDFFQEWPRHAVSLQMADLDRMREAIRKHRFNRQLPYPAEEQSTYLGEQNQNHMNTFIHGVMQDPVFQYELDKEVQQHRCAKAA